MKCERCHGYTASVEELERSQVYGTKGVVYKFKCPRCGHVNRITKGTT